VMDSSDLRRALPLGIEVLPQHSPEPLRDRQDESTADEVIDAPFDWSRRSANE